MPNQFGELTDEEIFGAPAAPAAAAPAAGELSDEEVFGTAAPVPVRPVDRERYARPAPARDPTFMESFTRLPRAAVSGLDMAGRALGDLLLSGVDLGMRPIVEAVGDEAGYDAAYGDLKSVFDTSRPTLVPVGPTFDRSQEAPVVDQLVSGLTQGAAGFAGGMGAVRQLPQTIAKSPWAPVVGGAIGDFFAFSGDQPNVSNVVEDATGVPLATAIRPEDSELVGRMKNVAEGAGIVGPAFDLLMKGGSAAVRSIIGGLRGSTPNAEIPPESVTPEEWREVLKQMGADDRQLAALDENFGQQLAAGAGTDQGRAAVADALDAADAFGIARQKQDAGVYQVRPYARTPEEGAEVPRALVRAEQDNPTGQRVVEVTERDRGMATQPAVQQGSGQGGALVPVTEQPRAMSPEEIAHGQRVLGAEAQANPVQTPHVMRSEEGRLPQTPADIEGQRQAGGAFDLAEQQRLRAGPEIRDTQAGGRPEGQAPQQVYLDDDFPVRIVETRFVPNDKGRMIQVAKVQRYDPRTGEPEAGAPEYEVPMKELRTSSYSIDPRQSQDFVERAQSPIIDESAPAGGQRADDVLGLEEQTYRQTAQDPNQDFAGAGPGRSPFPEQPEGPGPWRTRPQNEEEILRRYEEARARDEARRAAGEQADSGPRDTDGQASNRPQDPDGDGRFAVDDRGFVTSTKGGPIRFADQKQAAKWILNAGHKKSPDQIFEIENHPSGKGFTVRERGRTEPPSGGAKPGKGAGQAAPGEPRALPALARQEPDGLADEVAQFRQGGPRGAAERLSTDLRGAGGIRDEGGDVTHIAGDTRGLPGLIRKGGMTLDDAALWAWERGYFPEHTERPTIREFLDALDDDLGGIPRYSPEGREAADVQARAATLDEWINRSGIDIDSMSDREAAGALRRWAAEEYGGQADDAAAEAYWREEYDDGLDWATEPGQGGPEGARVDTGEAAPAAGAPGNRGDASGGQQAGGDGRAAEAGGGASAQVKPSPSSYKGELYSGVPLNFMVEEAKKLFGWTVESAAAWKKSMTEFIDELSAARSEGKLKKPPARTLGQKVPGHSLFMTVVADKTAQVRSVVNRIADEKVRKLAHSIIDEWFTESGTTRGVSRTYDEAVASREVSRLNELGRVLGKHLEDAKALGQIVNLVRNPSQIRKGTPLGDAALGLQKLLREELEFMRAAGVDIGEVKSGYFPRATDEMKIRAKPDQFVEAATRAYRKAGLNAKDAEEAAKSWRDHILYGDNGSIMVPPGGTIDANFVRGRTLPKEADEILKDFLINDPRYALVHYLTRAARRAEFTRRVNGDAAWQKANAKLIREKGSAANARWQQMAEELEAAGAGDVVPHLRDYIATMAGVKPSGLSDTAMNALSWTRTWGTLGLLEKAMLTSIPEAVMPGIRSGSPANLARSLGYVVMQFAKNNAKGTKRAREFAEDLGMVVAHGNHILSAARFAGGDATSKFQQKVLQTYFRNTGLERFTNATRVAAVGVGQVFLRRLSRELADNPNITKALLAELGVPKDKAADFSKWLLAQDKGMPDVGSLRAAKDQAMAEMYRTAIMRFTDQSIMRPSAATRPGWASNPLGAVAFHLMNYTWAFQKNVLNRPFRLLKDEELSAWEKARVVAPVVGMMPALWAIQGLVSEGRDAVFGDPTRTEPRSAEEKSLLWLSRAGLTGKLDPAVNIATGVRYGRDVATTLLGSVYGRLAGAAQTGIEYLTRNSERTNAAERKMAKTAYDMGVEPLINFLLTALPAGSVAAAVARQVAGSGEAREMFTETLAGPPDEDTGGSSSGPLTGGGSLSGGGLSGSGGLSGGG